MNLKSTSKTSYRLVNLLRHESALLQVEGIRLEVARDAIIRGFTTWPLAVTSAIRLCAVFFSVTSPFPVLSMGLYRVARRLPLIDSVLGLMTVALVESMGKVTK